MVSKMSVTRSTLSPFDAKDPEGRRMIGKAPFLCVRRNDFEFRSVGVTRYDWDQCPVGSNP
jgi:hypothetical protein